MAGGKLLLGLALAGGIAGLVYATRKKSGGELAQVDQGAGPDGQPVTDDNAAGFEWLRVLAAVSGQEGGWSSVNLDDVGRGISWGMIQFNQGAGSLGQVLARWRQLDPAGFASFWGADGDALIRTLSDPSSAVRLGVNLGSGRWPDLFRRAGQVAAAQQAQSDIAWSSYMFPLLPQIGQTFGGVNDVVAGVVFDRSVNQGPGFTLKLLRDLIADVGAAPPGEWETWLDLFRDRAANGAGPARARVAARMERVYQALA